MDCGPTCLRMIARYYGKHYTLETLRARSGYNREGVSLLGISDAAESIGFRTIGAKLTMDELVSEVPLPCIVHWEQSHFVIVTPASGKKKRKIEIADPVQGLIEYNKDEFTKSWISLTEDDAKKGVALLLEPSPRFYEEEEEKATGKLGFGFVFKYLLFYHKLILQLFVSLLFGSLILLIFPFMTQAIVDIGINTGNIHFIYLVLIAQLTLFLSRTVVEFIRSWILLHISTRINLSILSDFLIKLMRMPVSFFTTSMYGDILQRVSDHRRIESFLTQSTLSVLFSIFNLVIFSFVLAWYNLTIFLVFSVFSCLYIIWITLFLKYRKTLDYKRFAVAAKENTAMLQIIQGMQEIKMNNSEQQMRWDWENLQSKLFRFNFKSLSLSQYQQAGGFFLNEGKNILITFLAAKSVLEGKISLGTMLAIQYILGQLNSPLESFISFFQSAQDARISLDRLSDIHSMKDEEPADGQLVTVLPRHKDLQLQHVQFRYPGSNSQENVLNDINLKIPHGCTTAIVGMSGSGKTTLLKLLLKFHDPVSGNIKVGESNLNYISHKFWRSKVGTVLQDGYIFNDSIARNIAVGRENPDIERLIYSAQTANILDFIESLPLGFNTKIGAEGTGISQGQRQRILIARAVYKDPEYILFDEATNSLDANNEKVIMHNLESFFRNRTVVIVAHRLSTVKHADQIIVLRQGTVIESGTHETLIAKRGEYYTLVKNQLELEG